MTFVLWWIFVVHTHAGVATQSNSIEFRDREACMEALQNMHRQVFTGPGTLYAICAPKGKV